MKISIINTVNSNVSNKNLSGVSSSLALPRGTANPSCSIDTHAADSFEGLVGAIQLDLKGNELKISPEAAYFLISSLCSKKKSEKLSKHPHLLVSSIIIEKYSNKYISELSSNDLNSELQRLKSSLVKGVPEHEATSLRLVIQLLEQERTHKTALKTEKDKLKKIRSRG